MGDNKNSWRSTGILCHNTSLLLEGCIRSNPRGMHNNYRPQVLPLLLSLSSEMRKKPVRKNVVKEGLLVVCKIIVNAFWPVRMLMMFLLYNALWFKVICRDIFLSNWGQPGLLQRAPVHAQNKLSSVLSECASETLLPWKPGKMERIHRKLKKILSEEQVSS